MKLICPQCKTAYEVTLATLGQHGRQVRCARCQSTWFAEAPKLAANVVPLAAHEARNAPILGVVRTAPTAAPAAPVPAEPVPVPVPEPDPAGLDVMAVQAEMPDLVAVALSDAHEVTGTILSDAEVVVAGGDLATDAEPSGPIDQTTLAEDAGAALPEPAAAVAAAVDEVPAEPAPDTPVFTPRADIESVAARRIAARKPLKRKARPSWRARGLAAAIVALTIIDAALIICRADVVRLLPQTASLFETIGLPVNLRDLSFKDIKTTQEVHDGVQILVVEGAIVATGRAVTDVPRLRFAITAANGHEIYAWTALPTRTKLAPGEVLPFRTRLASPPEQGRSVKIRFFTRVDLATGLR